MNTKWNNRLKCITTQKIRHNKLSATKPIIELNTKLNKSLKITKDWIKNWTQQFITCYRCVQRIVLFCHLKNEHDNMSTNSLILCSSSNIFAIYFLVLNLKFFTTHQRHFWPTLQHACWLFDCLCWHLVVPYH